jgi:hypothetical protein
MSAVSVFSAKPREVPRVEVETGVPQGLIRERNFSFETEEEMLRNRETSRTNQLLETVSKQLAEVHSKLDDSITENRDMKRRMDYLEEELAKRACWDPALQEERQRYTYFLVEGSVALKRRQGGIRAELYKHGIVLFARFIIWHFLWTWTG